MVILLSRGWVKKYYYYFRFLLPAKLQMWARILAGYAGYILLGSCLCRKKKVRGYATPYPCFNIVGSIPLFLCDFTSFCVKFSVFYSFCQAVCDI